MYLLFFHVILILRSKLVPGRCSYIVLWAMRIGAIGSNSKNFWFMLYLSQITFSNRRCINGPIMTHCIPLMEILSSSRWFSKTAYDGLSSHIPQLEVLPSRPTRSCICYELPSDGSLHKWRWMYTVSQKRDTILLSISSLNIDRFS